MIEHTPTPWDIIAGDDYYITAEGYPKEFIGHFKGDDNGGYLAIVGNRPKDFGLANAAFIVKAVNSHAEMDRLLAEAADELNNSPRMRSMDIGAKITAFRLQLQKGHGDPVSGAEGRGE